VFVTLFFKKYFCVYKYSVFSENLKGRLGKIKEGNIKIDAREMEFEGVQRLGGLNVIFVTPTLLEVIKFRHLQSPFKRLK
jgi:hypothetical protein